jgi:hypothetical protein
MRGTMLEEISSSTSAVMSGTGQEVARQPYRTPEQKTVVVTFSDGEKGGRPKKLSGR